jgi:hypothetical protein
MTAGLLLFAFLGLLAWLVNRGDDEPKGPRPTVLTWS